MGTSSDLLTSTHGSIHVKTNLLSYFAAAIVFGMPSIAASQDMILPGEFSGNVSVGTDYVFRGYSQTLAEPTLQGGLDWDSGFGIYAGMWGSNVNFGDADNAHVEMDFYAGYAGEVDAFSYDVGFLYYMYPGASNTLKYDFWELYGSVGYDFGPAAVSAGLAWTPDNFGGTNDALYYSAGISVPVADVLSFDANIGYYDFTGGGNFADWNIGTTLNVYDVFDADLRYYDTDVSAGCVSSCESRVVFSISRSF
ncbi:MAG: hypothetical protein CMG46_12780 [Candidatus Marinimicrobia bacterium]|nr:hypothetical protein [Candidatus Neomarinimicrobiota bacterium]